jgi:hypothetical protein
MEQKCFKKFKKEVLRLVKASQIGSTWYRLVWDTKSYDELMRFIKEHRDFLVHNGIVSPTLIDRFQEKFDKYNIQL